MNSRLQPTQIALGGTQNATDLLDLDYSYGMTQNNGNVLSQTITVPTVGSSTGFTAVQTYNYDSLNRLKDATEMITPHGGSQTQSWKQTYQFDRYGNRRFDFASGATTTPESTCPPAVCDPAIDPNNNKITSTGYTFDAAGNTTRDAQDRKFTYDAENKQIKVESLSPGTNTVTGTIGEYVYDGDGRRVKKRAYQNNVLTEETIFVYDAAGKLIGEYSNQVASQQDAKIAYLTNDHLGSPRISTDINGNVTARHDYHPFGEEIATAQRTSALGYAGDTVRKQFTGYERDIESGLDFAQARFYRATLARYSSADPMLTSGRTEAPQTWNRYAYVLGTPLTLVDPYGLYECKAGKEKCDKFEAAVAKAVSAMKQYDSKSKQYRALQRALKAFWDIKSDKSKLGVRAGLVVREAKQGEIKGDGEAAVNSVLSKTTTKRRGKVVSVDLSVKSVEVLVRPDAWDYKGLPGITANEGANVQDVYDAAASNRQNSEWQKEYTSLEAELFVHEKLRADEPLDFNAGRGYDPSWAKTDLDANRDKAIRKILQEDVSKGGYGLKPPKQKR